MVLGICCLRSQRFQSLPDGGLHRIKAMPQTLRSSLFAELHYDLIGNVAVQLRAKRSGPSSERNSRFGSSRPSLPTVAPFFPSWKSDYSNARRMQRLRLPAMLWVPAWMWHRVDNYIALDELAIGGSLFHSRALEFLRNNPLSAVLMVHGARTDRYDTQ